MRILLTVPVVLALLVAGCAETKLPYGTAGKGGGMASTGRTAPVVIAPDTAAD
jgi:hypothetical protein